MTGTPNPPKIPDGSPVTTDAVAYRGTRDNPCEPGCKDDGVHRGPCETDAAREAAAEILAAFPRCDYAERKDPAVDYVRCREPARCYVTEWTGARCRDHADGRWQYVPWIGALEAAERIAKGSKA